MDNMLNHPVTLPQNIKPSRTSNSRNINSHLQASQTGASGQHQTINSSNGGAINFNQMNLTSMSNKHASNISTGAINQSFNSSSGGTNKGYAS